MPKLLNYNPFFIIKIDITHNFISFIIMSGFILSFNIIIWLVRLIIII